MGDFNDDIEGGLERALAKLTANFGVTKYVVTNKNGIPVSTYEMDEKEATRIAALLHGFTQSSSEFLTRHDLADHHHSEQPQIQSIRLRTRKYELVVCPDVHYTIIVVHDPNYVKEAVVEQVNDDEGSDED